MTALTSSQNSTTSPDEPCHPAQGAGARHTRLLTDPSRVNRGGDASAAPARSDSSSPRHLDKAGEIKLRGPGSGAPAGARVRLDDAGGLAGAMAGLAEDLQRALTCAELAAALLAAAVGLVPGAERGSVCLRRGRLPGLRTDPVVSTDALTDALEVLQRRLGQGPSMDALHERTPVLVADLAAEQHRWPVLSAHAKTQDVSSAMCLPLTVAGEHFGSLNLFADAVGAFDHTSQHAGVLLSMHAAIAAAHLHAVGQLHSALEHRDVIGQAKGILVERHKLHPDQAFGVLSTVSQNSNCKLHEVARELTTTGALPSHR